MTRRIFWTPAEFDKIAATVKKRFPQKHYEAAKTIEDIDLSMRELMDSARQALPPDRYRTVHYTAPMKMGLLGAFARARGEAGPLDGGNDLHPVRWTVEEWRLVAEALQRLFPEADYPRSTGLEKLKLAQLNAAAATLPVSRRRSFVALSGPRSKLQAIYDGGGQPAPVKLTPAPKPVPLVAPQKPPKQLPKRVDKMGRQTKVYWTESEWQSVASELQRRFPSLAHPSDQEALMRLHAKDFEFAQKRVLPPHRWRASLANMKSNRNALALALPKVAQFEAAPAADLPVVAAATPAAVTAVAMAPSANAWEQAVRPLAELLAKEFVAALLPELLSQLQPLLAQSRMHAQPAPQPGQQQQPAATELDQQPAPQPPAIPRAYPFLKPPQEAKPKPAIYVPPPSQREQPKVQLPKIGVVGPLPIQQQTLKAAFPNVKLLFVEKSNDGKYVVEKLAGCQRVIGMIGFMSHSGDGALRKHFGDRYTRVTGSVSNIKTQIEAWLKDGVIHQSVAQGRYEPVA